MVKAIQLFFITIYCCFYAFSAQAQVFINEIQASNNTTIADNFLEYDDWLELYNTSNNPINLAGYYLSDDILQLTKFQIPITDATATTIPGNGFILFWADGDEVQGANHCSFKLSTGGETVFLVDADGITIIDSLTYQPITADQTFKRIPDASNNVVKSAMASPQNSNNNDMGLLDPPLFSLASGSYSGSKTVALSATNGATIYYTTDGSEPNTNSPVYQSPISVSQNTAIRAIAARNGFTNSEVVSQAYLIGTNHDLPIITINMDDKYLYSDQDGILVIGTNGTSGDCGADGNFQQDWEHPGNVIYLDENGNEAFNVDGGISVFGNCSRSYAQKSLVLKTKEIFQSANIPYPVFPTQQQDEYRRLRFRNGGNHWKTSMMGDMVFHTLIENKFDVDVQSGQPAVSYLNGEYNGIFNIRHAYSKHYFRNKFEKYEDSDFDIIRMRDYHNTIEVSDGDTTEIKNLYAFFEPSNSFSNQEIEEIYNKIDVNEFMNYYISNMWLYVWDWPGTSSPSNMIYWRAKEPDAKWRLAVLDADQGWAERESIHLNHDTYTYLREPDENGRNNERSIRFISRLNNEVPGFNEEFVQRAFTYCNLVFHKDTVAKKIDSYKALMNNEMYDHIDLWGDQGGVSSHSNWLNEVNGLKDFANQRGDIIKNYMADYHNESIIDLTFNFNQNTNGTVLVNANFFDIPENYTGEYLADMPLWIHAAAKPGYRFVEWWEISDPAIKYNPSIYTSFNANQTLTPIFEPALDLVINEIHYNPLGVSEQEEFIELYNPDNRAKPLFGYRFNNGVEFIFPENAVINPGEYIIVAKDETLYSGNGYQVFQWTCGSLNNDGERVFFSNPSDAVIDSVKYNDNIDWDQNADGLGYSLALIDYNKDNYQPSAWASQLLDQTTPGAANNFCETMTNNAVLVDVSCYGANDGFIATQIIGGTAPFTYAWSQGANSSIANNLSAGQYTVTVTDVYNCLYIETFTINEPTPLNATVTSTHQTYYNINNGTASVTSSGGIPPYTFSWFNGASGSSITNLAPGNYPVTITDANNCTNTKTVNIQAIACNMLQVVVNIQHESCVGSNDGSIRINSIQNGIAPYSILWSNNMTNTIINNLPGGNYQLVITDDQGCTFEQSYTVNAASAFSINTVITNASSNSVNDGAIDLTVTGGTVPYRYYWSNGATTEDNSGLATGIYWVNILDDNDCDIFKNNLQVGSNCLVSIVQQNQPLIASSIYQAANFIQSNGRVNTNEQVGFHAGNYIELKNNFEVLIGAEFEAWIESCQ